MCLERWGKTPLSRISSPRSGEKFCQLPAPDRSPVPGHTNNHSSTRSGALIEYHWEPELGRPLSATRIASGLSATFSLRHLHLRMRSYSLIVNSYAWTSNGTIWAVGIGKHISFYFTTPLVASRQ